MPNEILACKNCQYVIKTTEESFAGVHSFWFCRRYPKPVQKKKNDWCGEWSALIEKPEQSLNGRNL